jgi:hypothetical protein
VRVAANQDYYVGFNTIFFQIYSDVTLVCPEGAEIPAHQNILAGSSQPVF